MIPDDPLAEYAAALALTLLAEVPLVAWALARWYRVPPATGAALGLVGSLLTHPLVWWVLPQVVPPSAGRLTYLLVAEGFAWLAEAALYWLVVSRRTRRRDLPGLLLLSLLANMASFALGSGLQAAGLW